MTLSAQVTWSELQEAAPEIARLGRQRLDQTRVALLGTLGADGSPHISPIEPYFALGHLIFGAMSWSSKARDLLRDPRCTLHSAISSPDSGEGELKIHGIAVEADDRLSRACEKAWWIGRAPELARVFSLNIARAAFITWDIEHGEMTIRTWSPDLGSRIKTRSYP